MLPDNNIKNELETLGCTCLATGIPMALTVPEGYFTTLPGIVLNTLTDIQDENLPSVLHTPGLKQTPFKTPEDYFEHLSNKVLTSLEQDTAIDQLFKPLPQEVPAGYFDTLPGNILNRVKTSEIPVINLTPRKKSWMKYAVAAALAGLIALSGIAYFTNRSDQAGEGTASVDAQVFQSLQSVSEQKLEQMVNTLANETVSEKTLQPATSTAAKTETLVAGLLQEVPTAELASFLTDFEEDADNETIGTIN